MAIASMTFWLIWVPSENPNTAVDPMPDKGAVEKYTIALRVPFKGATRENAVFRVFFGPSDIDLLRSYEVGLEKIISLGWTWVIRPISEYIMLPLMSFLFYIVPNWGVVIILFSIG